MKNSSANEYHAEWVHLRKMPELIFDHKKMVDSARKTTPL